MTTVLEELDIIKACCDAILKNNSNIQSPPEKQMDEKGETREEENMLKRITTTDVNATRHSFDKTIMEKIEFLKNNSSCEKAEKLIVISMCQYIYAKIKELHGIIGKYLMETTEKDAFETILSRAPAPLRIANRDIGKHHRAKNTTEFLKQHAENDFGWVVSQPDSISIHYFQPVSELNTFAVLPIEEIFMPKIIWKQDETAEDFIMESVPLKILHILNKQLVNMLEIHLTNRTFVDLFTLFGAKDEFVINSNKWGWDNGTYAVDYFRSVHDFIRELVICADMTSLPLNYWNFCLQQIEMSLYKVFMEFQRLEIAVGNTTSHMDIDAVYKHHIRLFHLKTLYRPVDEWLTGNLPVLTSHASQQCHSFTLNQFQHLKNLYMSKCEEAKRKIYDPMYREVYDYLYPIRNKNET